MVNREKYIDLLENVTLFSDDVMNSIESKLDELLNEKCKERQSRLKEELNDWVVLIKELYDVEKILLNRIESED